MKATDLAAKTSLYVLREWQTVKPIALQFVSWTRRDPLPLIHLQASRLADRPDNARQATLCGRAAGRPLAQVAGNVCVACLRLSRSPLYRLAPIAQEESVHAH